MTPNKHAKPVKIKDIGTTVAYIQRFLVFFCFVLFCFVMPCCKKNTYMWLEN